MPLLWRSLRTSSHDEETNHGFTNDDETTTTRVSRGNAVPKAAQASILQWCHGDQALGRRCPTNALQHIVVNDNSKEEALTQLTQALQSRRLLTNAEHLRLAKRFQGITIGNQVFERASKKKKRNRSAYHFYSLYAYAMLNFPKLDTRFQRTKPLWLELGVFRGMSCNVTASIFKHTMEIHGFDTFTGLPEAWRGQFGKGYFSLEGTLPPVAPQVYLHKGLFNETLSDFFRKRRQKRHRRGDIMITGMNIDCDLYQGARETLELTWSYWKAGVTLLHFHELFQENVTFQIFRKHQHEAEALVDFMQAHPGMVLQLWPVASLFCEPAVLQVLNLPH